MILSILGDDDRLPGREEHVIGYPGIRHAVERKTNSGSGQTAPRRVAEVDCAESTWSITMMRPPIWTGASEMLRSSMNWSL